MPRILIWDEATAPKKLAKQLESGMLKREPYLRQMDANDATVFPDMENNGVRYDFEDLYSSEQEENGVNINYTFKNLRFIHAQMSANPPTVVPRPTSSDNDDRRKADAADRLIRYAIRQYDIPEHIDQLSLNTLLYGYGFIKVVWDSMKGDLSDLDEETGEIIMEGDFSFTIPHPRSIVLDHQAKHWSEVRYLYEEISMSVEEAEFRWPDKMDIIRKAAARQHGHGSNTRNVNDDDIVKLWEYHEKGLPINGMLGKYCICLTDGTLIEPIRPHPNRFNPPMDQLDKKMKAKAEAEGREWKRMPPTAVLPYGYLSDIDVPDSVYAKSFVEYEVDVQETINRLDAVTLDNLEAHSVGRLILPEGAELEDNALSNSPWDVVKMTGSQPPHFMENMKLPPDMTMYRDRLVDGIDQHAGINASMMGQMDRETAGFALQYATNQGNLVRRRLFNKYVKVVEWTYKAYLNLVRKHWDEPHTIKVLGKERAFEAFDIQSADIDGGYDFVAEYGSSLSLDPMTRREEIMNMLPMFEKAGVASKTLLRMLKLNELEGMFDMMEMASLRQREIFERMIETEQYVAPEELEEHKGMLDYAYQFRMSSEYKYLPSDEVKMLVDQHIKEREMMAAKGAGAPDQPGAPGPDPQGGQPPAGMMAGAAGQAPAPPLVPQG